MKKIVVIIPVYQNNISEDESLSMRLAAKFLSSYSVIFIAPEGFDSQRKYNQLLLGSWKYFPEEYFKSPSTYSKLMLSSFFYKSFSEYGYMLIYQLDGLVLNRSLEYWCSLGYSYIGAPLRFSALGLLCHQERKFFEVVGNGGISLRKISDFYKLLHDRETLDKNTFSWLYFIASILSGKTAKKWMNVSPKKYPFNEDGYWSFEAEKYDKNFSVAPLDIAAQFSLERFPSYFSRKYLEGELPFAAHAWKKYELEWWEEKFSKHKNRFDS